MFKKLFVLLAALTISCAAFAKPLSFVQNGEYVYYLDTRGNTPYFRGFLFLNEDDDTMLLHRSVNLETGNEYTFSIFVSDTGSQIDFLGTGGDTSAAGLEIQQSIVDVLNFASMQKHCENDIKYELKDFDDPWETYTQVYRFGKIVPGFCFTSITLKDEDPTVGYFLNCWGFAQTDADVSTFLHLKPRDYTPTDRGLSLEIPEAKPMKVTMNGMKATLDYNWVSNNSMGQPGYWLQTSSVRDSQIMIEDFSKIMPLDSEDAQAYITKLVMLNTPGIDPSTLYFSFNKKQMFVSYEVYDEQNLVSYQEFQIRKNKVINFSTFKDIYIANAEYYKKILKSIK